MHRRPPPPGGRRPPRPPPARGRGAPHRRVPLAGGASTDTNIQEGDMQHDMSLQERSATRAEELPGAERTHQSTGDWEVWKVGGKVFMLQTAMPGEPVVILKADPAHAVSLREAHTQIP